MTITNSRDKREFAELSKLINKSRVRDIRNHNVKEIEAAVKKGVSFKTTKRKLCAGKNIMHAVKDKTGKIVTTVVYPKLPRTSIPNYTAQIRVSPP